MTYEYACQACGHTWEAEQRIKDAPLKDCASCGAPKAKRLISGGTGFLLKGGGWYADGYGSAPASKSSGDSEGSSSKAASSDAGSKDAGNKDGGSKKAESTASDSKSSDAGSKSSSDTTKTASAAS